MKNTRLPALLLAMILAAGGTTLLVGCEEHDGPAERAGEKIDRAIDDVKD